MDDAYDFIKYRHIRNCYHCDPAYGEGVAKSLGLSVETAFDAQAMILTVISPLYFNI